MKICIVIPAHNEAAYIKKTLESLATQSLLPEKIIVVDDHSTDQTPDIVKRIALEFPFISLVRNTSQGTHAPGGKIVDAFYKGIGALDEKAYDVICKFDADLIFPSHYLESIAAYFRNEPTVGMAGGFCQIERNGQWVMENLTSRDHLRGALKAYRKKCFIQIGGLRSSMGWDTADELLAQYHGWRIITDDSLMVKHLKPTGTTYTREAKWKQGEAFYKLRYGFFITLIASLKLALNKKKPSLVKDYLQGFFKARAQKMPFLVNQEEGAFIRRLRYKKMLSKIF